MTLGTKNSSCYYELKLNYMHTRRRYPEISSPHCPTSNFCEAVSRWTSLQRLSTAQELMLVLAAVTMATNDWSVSVATVKVESCQKQIHEIKGGKVLIPSFTTERRVKAAAPCAWFTETDPFMCQVCVDWYFWWLLSLATIFYIAIFNVYRSFYCWQADLWASYARLFLVINSNELFQRLKSISLPHIVAVSVQCQWKETTTDGNKW